MRIFIKTLFFTLIFISLLCLGACNDPPPFHGHDFGEWETVTPATCTTKGSRQRLCSCGEKETAVINTIEHTLSKNTVAPTCETQGYTTYSCECGYSFDGDFTAPLGHNLKETVTPPTCTKQGFTFFECEACDYEFYGDHVAPLAHKGTNPQIVYPTVIQSGYTLYECEHCKQSYKENYIAYSDIVSGAYTENTEVLKKGIDTSIWNHPIDSTTQERQPLDWAAIKAAGVDFVILKAGSSNSGKDEWFEADYAAAKAAGLEVGAYFYAYSSTVADTVSDAAMLLEWLEGKQFEYPIYFDIEHGDLETHGKEQLTKLCVAFAETIQSAGYYCGIYVNNNWLVNILDTEKITSSFDVWYARYRSTDDMVWGAEPEWTHGDQMCLWQYTQSGVLEGFEGKFDFNYSYKNYHDIMVANGLNGF